MLNRTRTPLALLVSVVLLALATLTPPVSATAPDGGEDEVAAVGPGVGVYQPICDTSISRWYPSTNYSGEGTLQVRQGDIVATLLAFDLSDLPKGTRIRSAKLRVYVHSRTNEGHLNVGVHQVMRPWSCDQVTWERASEVIPWGADGANDLTTDRAHWAEDALWLEEQGRWYELDVTHLVGAWVSARDANYGLILKAESGVSVAYSFASTEHAEPALAPKLLVDTGGFPTITPTYTPTITPQATSTPEPTPTEEPARLYYLPLVYR